MNSEKTNAANRINARKSRGPRTAAGKSRARHNALRHGLATITRFNPALCADIELMAKAICGDDMDPLVFEQSLIIAETETVLRCVRAERVAVIERLREAGTNPLTRRDNSLALARARFREAKRLYPLLDKLRAGEVAAEDVPAYRSPVAARTEPDAMRHAMPDLDRIARYERRAWSRRKRAINILTRLKAERSKPNSAVNSYN